MRLFNRGFYFESHELLEELWHPSEGKDRLHYQALIQMAVALRHVQHHNWPGAMGLYQKAKDKWAELPEKYKGLDLKALKESLDPLFDKIKKAADEGQAPVDLPAIPKIPLPV